MRLMTCGALVLALSTVGCGSGKDQPIKVAGVLTWEDGVPIPQAQIEFVPLSEGKLGAMGMTGADGRFELTTFNTGDGALPGKYKVVVVKREARKEAHGGGPPEDVTKAMQQYAKDAGSGKRPTPQASLLPEVYAKATTTPLQETIEPGRSDLKLTLKKS